jgi:nitrate/nitrite transport system permease protein
VSPLAWLPIGLLVFKAANPAAIWTIFICSHLADDPQHRRGRAARAAGLPERGPGAEPVEWKIFTKILFPSCCPTC